MSAIPTTEMSLVQCIKHYFDIDGSKMIAEFKALSEQDKQDFEKMLSDLGYNVKPRETK